MVFYPIQEPHAQPSLTRPFPSFFRSSAVHAEQGETTSLPPIIVRRHYAFRTDMSQTLTRVVYSGDEVLRNQLRTAIRDTYLIRLSVLLIVMVMVVITLQLLIENFSTYIFWVTIIFLAIVFSQIMRLSRHLYYLDHMEAFAPTSSFGQEITESAPPPPPTYHLAAAQPPAYVDPKPSMDELTRRYQLSRLGLPPTLPAEPSSSHSTQTDPSHPPMTQLRSTTPSTVTAIPSNSEVPPPSLATSLMEGLRDNRST